MSNVDINSKLLEIKFHVEDVLNVLEQKGLKYKAEVIIKLIDDICERINSSSRGI